MLSLAALPTTSALDLCRFINALYETPVSEQSLEAGRRLFLHGCLQAATTAAAGSSVPTKRALVIAPHIPPLFICRYMSACAAIGDRSVQVWLVMQAVQHDNLCCPSFVARTLQSRIVRIVCELIRALADARVVNLGDLSAEIQAFCVEYSRVREAALLFRELKSTATTPFA